MSDASRRRDFRNGYLNYADLTATLVAWSQRYPQIMRLESIGRTPEGRDLWLALIGPEPQKLRPAVWVNASMHASELCGSNVALALIEDLLALHLGSYQQVFELPESMAGVTREVLFYVMPRMSPDGAEAVLQSGRWLRSVPRDTRQRPLLAHWRGQDLDGDGLILSMRYPDDSGEFVESKSEPGLMLRRSLEDSGPFYQLAIEGVIDNFDGQHIPATGSFDDHFPDLNRNFPWSWAPEPEQEGAGPFPLSEPESKAVVEFTLQHPNIFAWADLHSFGGVFIRPLGHAPDVDMHPNDLSLYHQIGEWAARYTGYPTVSGFEQFTYSPNRPLRGDIVDFAYHQRGTLAYTCELWDIFEKLGLPRQARFADHYVRLGRAEHKRLWHWDREHNQSRIFLAWRKVKHPQLGSVEVGGVDPRIGLWNPPEAELPKLCRGQVDVMLRLASMAPRVRIVCLGITHLSGDIWQASVLLENVGYLPSHVLDSARSGPLGDPPRLEIIEQGCQLENPNRQLLMEHLAGWGGGLYNLAGSLLSLKSKGGASKHHLTLTVRGHGSLLLRLTSPRLGLVETTLSAPDEAAEHAASR